MLFMLLLLLLLLLLFFLFFISFFFPMSSSPPLLKCSATVSIQTTQSRSLSKSWLSMHRYKLFCFKCTRLMFNHIVLLLYHSLPNFSVIKFSLYFRALVPRRRLLYWIAESAGADNLQVARSTRRGEFRNEKRKRRRRKKKQENVIKPTC